MKNVQVILLAQFLWTEAAKETSYHRQVPGGNLTSNPFECGRLCSIAAIALVMFISAKPKNKPF